MAEPITWRNVNGPSLAEASRPMEAAVNTFNSAFTPLQNILKGREDTEVANLKQGKENNLNAFMNTLYSATTPEQMQALKDSGQLGRMLETFGAQIDQAKAREAMDARPTALMTQAKTAGEFADFQRNQKDAPLMGEAKAKLYQGDFKGAQSLIAQLSPQNQGVLSNDYQAYKRELEVRANTDAKAKADLDHLKAQETHWTDTAANQKIQADAARISANAAASQARTHADQVAFQAGQALEQRLSGLISKRGDLTTTISSSEGMKTTYDELAKLIKDPKELEFATQAAGRLAAMPEFSNATPSAVVNSVMASRDSGAWYRPWSNTGNTAIDNLRQTMSVFNSNDAAQARAAQIAALDQQIAKARMDLKYPTAPTLPVPAAANPAPAAQPALPGPQAAPAPLAYQPRPGVPADLVDRAVAAAQVRNGSDTAERAKNAAKEADQAKRAGEISWLTTNEISVMNPREAESYLKKYSDVLPGGPNGRLANALRQRM